MNDDINYDEIRARVKKRIQDRWAFFIHLTAFVGVNLMLWAIWLYSDGQGLPWPMFVTIPWGIGLVAHAGTVFLSGTMEQMQQREIEKEIERERQRRGISEEKRKNDSDASPMRISDEGELIPADDESQPRSTRSERR
jgi:hypothetical protein